MTERTVGTQSEPEHEQPDGAADEETITCVKCGAKGIPLHRGCPMCEECCDCRPLGT